MVTWIQAVLLSFAVGAVTLLLSLLTLKMRKRSPRSSNAADAWRIEYDSELADLKSAVAGLSSTLRKLHGRESQRLRRDSPESESPAIDKNELRRKYGIIPRVERE